MVTGIGDSNHYLDNDFNMLSRCDAVLVLPFEEILGCGTGQELDLAEHLGIPVYTQNYIPTASVFQHLMELEEEAIEHLAEINADI
jgi:hypothetical protein